MKKSPLEGAGAVSRDVESNIFDDKHSKSDFLSVPARPWFGAIIQDEHFN
jgi:hypothetical protein